jgi:hypothetical protein
MATTTPNYGWDVPTSTDYVKDGATAIETLGDDIDATLYTALGGAYPGMRLIKKQTVGTSVSTVTVTNAFSATYEGYKIVYTGGVSAGTSEIWLKLDGITSGYESLLMYGAFGANTPINGVNGGGSQWGYAGGSTTNGAMLDVDVWNPFQAKRKWGRAQFQQLTVGNNGMTMLMCTSTASATDFTIGNATMTGGTIYVYGYGAS